MVAAAVAVKFAALGPGIITAAADVAAVVTSADDDAVAFDVVVAVAFDVAAVVVTFAVAVVVVVALQSAGPVGQQSQLQHL